MKKALHIQRRKYCLWVHVHWH